MPLRAYILALFATIVAAVLLLFHEEANSILSRRFAQLDSLHARSVAQYAETVLKARRYLLDAYREILGRDAELAKLHLLDRSEPGAPRLKEKLAALRKTTGCDIVQIVEGAGAEPRTEVRELPGGPALVSRSPLKLYHDVIGTLVLGYYLNGQIAQEIARATDSRVRFQRHAAETGALPIALDSARKPSDWHVVVESSVIRNVDRDTRGSILTAGAWSFVLATLLLYALLNLGFIRSFRVTLSEIDALAADLDRGVVRESAPRRWLVREVSALSAAFSKYSRSLKEFHGRVLRKTRTEALGEAAAQVAHDLSGPLAALEMALDLDRNDLIPESKKDTVRGLLARLRHVASSVLDKDREGDSPSPAIARDALDAGEQTVGDVLLADVLSAALWEKRLQYARVTDLVFDSEVDPQAPWFARVARADFARIVSNLLDNAVQAMPHGGTVSVSLLADAGDAVVRISDTGAGIAHDVLPRLFERGASFGKQGGSGLGLWSAREKAREWGGDVTLRSEPGRGTTVEVRLPLAPAPSWYLPALDLARCKRIVIVDDDPAIHRLWMEKLDRPDVPEVRAFHGAGELMLWREDEPGGETLFLIDHDLGASQPTGLDIVRELGIGPSTVLVTGRCEVALQRECARLGAKLVAKSRIPTLAVLGKGDEA